MLRHVDLCSGIGGFSLGFSWAELSKTIMFCDTEEWCRKILAKNFPNVPIAKDVKELANDPERNVPDHDILSCGYPCQPFSVAGLRKGEEDDRHIWPSIFRIITQKRPSWVVCENVYGHVALGLDKVLFDLESQSYATRTFIVPACAKNAPHRRDRLWIIARNVGDTEYNGSSSTEIRRSNQENAAGSQKGKIETEQLERASGRANHETMADTTSNGWNEDQSSEEQGSTFRQSEERRMLELEGGGSQPRAETMAYSKCLGWEQRSEEQEEFDREEPSDQFDFGSKGCRESRTSSSMAYSNCEGLQGSEETRNTEESRKNSDQFFTRHGGTSEDVADTSRVRGQNFSRNNPENVGRWAEKENVKSSNFSTNGRGYNVADTISQRTSRRKTMAGSNAKDVGQSPRIRQDEGIWFSEPNVGRVAHGIPKRMDRLKGLGNAIVPQLAMQIGLAIKSELS